MRRAVVAALLLSGCVVGVDERPVRPAAPEPPREVAEPAPAPGLVWIPGAFRWEGTAYAWVPGRWEAPPPRALAR